MVPGWPATLAALALVGFLAVAGVLLGSVGMALAPGPVPDNPVPVENPFGVEAAGGALAAVRSAGVAMVLAAALGAAVSLLGPLPPRRCRATS